MDGDVLILTDDAQSMTFSKAGVSMTDGGNLFTGHSNTGSRWVLSASFVDGTFSNSDVNRHIDFQLLEVGGSLTTHGRWT